MTSREERDRGLRPYLQGSLESPFLDEELFVEETKAEWEARLAALESESPFLPLEPEAFEEEFIGTRELEFADEWETDEQYQDEMGLEDTEYLELEAPPMLKNPTKSDPPGQTFYVQIALGKDKRCIKRNEKKECIEYKTFTIRPMTGIFIPENYVPQVEVDLILYLHGHKTSIPGSDALIAQYWDGQKYSVFALREEVNASRKNVILIAPTLGLKSGAGDLVRRAGLDNYLDKVLDALKTYAPYQGQSLTLGNLVLAAHSGGGIYMRLLAVSSNRYAGKIKECWGFDSLYNKSDVKPWLKWAEDNPQANFYSYFYTKLPTYNSRLLEGKASNIIPIESNIKDHFKLVKYYLGERLRGASFLNNTRGSAQELSEFPLNELEDELYLSEDELSLDELEDSNEFQELKDEQGSDLEDLEEEAYADENEDWEATESEIPSPLREAIVRTAKQEWERWEQGTKTETDRGMRDALRDYWMNLGDSQNRADQKIDGRNAWSAAFISYVMRKAGAGNAFAYSATHTNYIAAAKKAAISRDTSRFWAYEISGVKPEVGDLVCRDRPPKTGMPCAGTNFANVDKGGISHCDIVVEAGSDYIVILGGNTSQSYPKRGKGEDTVGQRKIKLDQRGFVIADQLKCKYFAIVKPFGQGSPAQSTPSPQSVAKPPAELVRFAQRVLNATEGEQLNDDGDLGRYTRGALERFRTKYNLGAGGVLSDNMQLALAQRALEEIAQQSIFAQLGVFEVKTEQALITFKSERGLGFGATLDTATRAALTDALARRGAPTGGAVIHHNVNTQLPVSGPGYYGYYNRSRKFGKPDTIRALQAIGAAWQRAHPQGPRLGIGDISLRGGGPISGHKSHQLGADVDIRLMRNDGREEQVVYQSPQYSRQLTQELINWIRANGILSVRYIFFNDPAVSGVKPWPNHDNHLHVRFLASSVDSEIEETFDDEMADA